MPSDLVQCQCFSEWQNNMKTNPVYRKETKDYIYHRCLPQTQDSNSILIDVSPCWEEDNETLLRKGVCMIAGIC